ncbi:MAG: RNA polymerase factor sigma-54 [Geminicoccaceae bacterium]
MDLGLRLDLRQKQSLVMTPQLQQAVKLLQMSNLDLSEFVEQEIAENPFLERGQEAGENEVTLDAAEPGPGSEWDARDESRPDLPRDSASDQALIVGSTAAGGGFDGDLPDFEQRFAQTRSLQDHLRDQLVCATGDVLARRVGAYLIDGLDEAGYLHLDLADAAEELACKAAEIEAVLTLVQTFEPTGVFARSPAECLGLQLRERDRCDPCMQRLLDNLDGLIGLDPAALARRCGVDRDELMDMIHELKQLDPKPGLAFAASETNTVVPDIVVTPRRDGWRIELNPATLPRVLVSADYYAEIRSLVNEPAEKSYVAERFQSASWLAKALDQRARTMMRVSEVVVEHQDAFLRRGVRHLKPLVLREVAEATGLHESTVSRATTDKYLATPQGTIPFKYLFTNAVSGDQGDGVAAEAVRQQIKDLIEREAAEQVLSDDRIVEILATRGVKIARRTVAKYRDSLGIPSSSRRRRVKALAG